MSSNAIISYPDRSLTATLLPGGTWLETAPLAILLDPVLSHVARSTTTLASASIIRWDLGAAYPIRVLSFCAHNLTSAGTIRVRGYSDSGFTTLVAGADTGVVPAWPAGFTARNVSEYPKNWTYCFAAAKTARYWQWEPVDVANPSGHIEVGRTWHGEATFEPETGVSFGMSLGYASYDVIEDSNEWGEKRTPKRAQIAVFKTLTPAEKRAALVMQKVLTETTEAFWVSDSHAMADDMLLEAFPSYMSKPSPIAYPYFNNNEMPISIIERV